MIFRRLLSFSLLILLGACQYNDTMVIDTHKSPNTHVNSHKAKETIAPEISTGRTEKPIVTAKKFMVVSANPLATQAGQGILAKGGSAVDAAIAVQAVLNVVEPQSSGIGGGGFLVHYDKQTNHVIAYDGREVAPKAVSSDLFIDKKTKQPIPFTEASIGGRAVAVPGVVKMLALAHKEQGKLPWKSLFDPAIKIAENGYPLSPRLYSMLKVASHYRELAHTDFNRYLNADGTIKNINTLIYNKPLAETFKKIASNGADVFYTGDIAQDIIKSVTQTSRYPSALTLTDLKNYQPKKRDVPCVNYHRYRLCGMPPPSSGGVTVLQALKMLERFNLQDYDYYNPKDVHLTASALRLAYADRNKYLADPDFVSVPTQALLTETYLRKRSALIDPLKAIDIAPAGDPSEPTTQFASLKTSEPPSTTHMSIVDATGDAVSFTTTIEQAFGSGLATKSGFILNNQMTDFDFIPEIDGIKVANRIEAGKRPRSSMAPFLVFNPQGQLMAVVGSPGGARIISYVLPRILSLIHSKRPLDTMLAAPNMTAMSPKAEIELESDIDLKDLDNSMIKYGYKPIITDLTSGLHIIYLKQGLLYGAADPRREGTAGGK